jgi:hypothetical protein
MGWEKAEGVWRISESRTRMEGDGIGLFHVPARLLGVGGY